MFQNIAKDFDEDKQNQNEDVEYNTSKKRSFVEAMKRAFTKQNIILYIIAFMVSMVGIGEQKEIAPFGLAMLVAILGNGIPIGIPTILVAIGNTIAFGGASTLNFILTVFILIITMLIKPVTYEQDRNEKRKLGGRLVVSTLLVQVGTVFFHQVMVYDLLVGILYSVAAYIFYKIFVNSLSVVTQIGEKRAYAIEEVMGASLMLAIAITTLSEVHIFDYSIANIGCIFLVLLMGWKHGILVGATAGITIGSVVGIIGQGDPILVGTYAISGMIAGIFSRFGKIGVIVGFIVGNAILTYRFNGNVESIIQIQEIFLAALGLLAVPKNVKIDIEDLFGSTKLLPVTTGNQLEESEETIFKLNSMSETISQMAKTYGEAAATVVEEEELQKREKENESIFDRELQNHLEGMEDNILFDDIYLPEESFLEDLFKILEENGKITRRELLDLLEKHNSYIVGAEKDYIGDDIEKDIKDMLRAITQAYKASKKQFVYQKKIEENQKVISNQLEEVSKAISNLAEEIEKPKEEVFVEEKIQIQKLLEQKDIQIKNISIKQQATGRIEVTLYTDVCENVENPSCDTKKMGRMIGKVFGMHMMLQKQECGLRLGKSTCSYTYVAEDKQNIQIGVARATKTGSSMSGDTSIQTRLDDGKYLLAISDGMGSGKEAKKSSKTAISMLEKLLTSGFDKDTSLKLINSTLEMAAGQEDMYATLDIAILDLYAKQLEFIKNGACPTYVKHGKQVEILKAIGLPTGIVEDIDLVVYERDLVEGDILVMCSDGVIESTTEYMNKELWLQFLLEEIETQDAQKIADLILQEAIDNGYGTQKDDMTVIVARITKKANEL